MYFDLLGKATPVHSGWDVLCVLRQCLSREALMLLSWQLRCFILCSGVPQEGSAPRGGADLYALGWKSRSHSLPGWSFPLLSSPTRKPWGLVAEKSCHIKILSVLFVCQSGKNRILNSASR